MNRVLLADDSPHAQRMGERILRDEGYEVYTVSDGETAMEQLAEADPDLVIVDAYLPGRSGFDICEHVKQTPRHRHARVILIAGLLERVDEADATRVGADAVLKKPFEASAMIATVRPLVDAAVADRLAGSPDEPEPDRERVRAAVTLALHQAMPTLIEELTDKVLLSLKR